MSGCIGQLAAWARTHGESLGADQFQYELAISDETGLQTNYLKIADDGNPNQTPMSLVTELIAVGSAG